jgi:type I restriction enzyme S subunit
MKKYDSYKDSGIEWIGEIPSHWNMGKIKYSDTVIMGQSPLSDDCNSEGLGLPFLQGNAEFGKTHPTPKLYCETPNKIADVNDVLLSVRAPVGALNIANQQFGIGRGLCAIRQEKSNFKYIYYWLLHSNKELDSVSTGSTFKAISLDDVKNINFPCIDIEEQTSIANYLEQKTAQIGDLIAK